MRDLEQLFKSITNQLNFQKNDFKSSGGDHKLTSGEWKESILKKHISNYLPNNIGINSGFILNKKNKSSQIDLLLYDVNIPKLFGNDDKNVVMVTPDSVKGMIEVKTTVNENELDEIIKKMFENLQIIRQGGNLDFVFTGLFSYETNMKPTKKNIKFILDTVYKYSFANGYISNINHISLGNSIFIKFWDEDPFDSSNKVYYTWHGYKLVDKAPAYFIMNSVVETSSYSSHSNSNLLFPVEGKEGSLKATLKQLK